ncbi:alpha,alpha-trehalase TreF [Ferruginibacter profundus]
MKQLLILSLLFLLVKNSVAQQPAAPDKIYGQLFVDVQMAKIFPDGKTFVDCTPKRKVRDIMYDYGLIKGPGLDLKKFVADNFNTPPPPPAFNYIMKEPVAANHIKNLWSNLQRDADKAAEGSSLLPLPKPYIVPGGRFREVYYWDSYFTLLGLKESGQTAMIENMVDNFAYLIYQYGHIPNGNRTYYLSRSQPPVFSLMVELLAGIKGNSVYGKYFTPLQKEYAYWTGKTQDGAGHMVTMPDGSQLSRYYDKDSVPRQESYKEDYELSEQAVNELAMRIRMASPEALKKILDDKRNSVCRNLRSGAESGWDFSSRWFADEQNISTIQTTDIIPVDLNCLLYHLETTLAKIYGLNKDKKNQKLLTGIANKRKTAIIKYCWNAKTNFFYDYNTVTKSQQANITAAGLFPLFVKIATTTQANGAAATVTKYLLKPGGLVTTTNNSGQQWDAPNGWAPLQWIAVNGLNNYKQTVLAKDIATRWLALNDKVYAATGKMMEKYNVEDLTAAAGGGEYPSQDGFGWTNGVYLALKALFKK